MAKDYYKTLGVAKTASDDEIKKAFRKLAHQYHPDKTGGDEAKFKEVSEAYNTLSDKDKRAQYDRFGDNPMGGGGASGGYGGFDPNGFGFDFSGFSGSGFEGGDIGDILSSIFGGAGRMKRGRDIQVDIELTFQDSIFGLKRTIEVNSPLVKQKKVDIQIPSGIEDGQMIRMTGLGENIEGGRAGDLYIKIHVKKHAFLRKEGYNLVMDLNIKLTEALLGATHRVETLDGAIELKIPSGTNTADILRVKGKGVPQGSKRGDLYVRIKVVLPQKLSKDAKKLIEELKKEGI